MEELAHAKDAKVGKDEVFLVHKQNSDRWGRTFRGVGGRGKFEIRNAKIGIGPTSSRAGGAFSFAKASENTSKGSRCARRLRRGLKD